MSVVRKHPVTGLSYTAELGTGTADATTFLRGDSTWQVAGSGGLGSVTDVTGTAPIVITGVSTITPNVTLDYDAVTLTLNGSTLQRAALTGDISAPAGSNATTLATVNANVGAFTYASITVNAKGLITAAANGTAPGPANATYITQTANATLTNEQALGSLASGMLSSLITTGVVSSTAFTSTRVAFGSGTNGTLTESANLTFGSNTLTVTGATPFVFGLGTVGRQMSLRDANVTPNYADMVFYPAAGTNVGSAFSVVPRGTGFSAGNKAQVSIYNSDYIADSTNYELLYVLAAGTSYQIVSDKLGTGTRRPIMLAVGTANANQILLNTDGSVDMVSLAAGGIVKATITSGKLGIAASADIVGAITWPGGNRVVFSPTASTISGTDGVLIDFANDQLHIAVDGTQVWRNLGAVGAGTYEQVRAYWTSDTFVLGSESAGGTVRNMLVQADTAALTLSAGGGSTLVAGIVGSNPSITASGSSIAMSPVGISVARSASATLDAVRVTAQTVSITGAAGTNITTATGFNWAVINAPTYNGGGNATTITTAATLMISGAPVAANGVTITNAYGLLVLGGRTEFAGASILNGSGTTLGFFGNAGTTRQTPTGSRGGNAALASLLTALAAYNLIVDGTSA